MNKIERFKQLQKRKASIQVYGKSEINIAKGQLMEVYDDYIIIQDSMSRIEIDINAITYWNEF